ncbi:MAG: ATP-binding protein [Deltaproteobacteria bacterium]|nr:ATP-binding protein [Deltaproteobacteria bacterium]
MIELALIDVRDSDGVVHAHQTARTIAAQLGFSTFEQTRIATAISEVARNALTYATGGTVTFSLSDTRDRLIAIVIDRGPGIADVEHVLSGTYRSPTGLGLGLQGCRRLMDDFALESSSSGTRVEMARRLSRRAPRVEGTNVVALRKQLAKNLADDPSQEIRRLQADIAERDRRLLATTEELDETNRGVMALHAELESRAEYQSQAIELRTQLLSEMGHELRTPLHSITTLSQFLVDRLDGELTSEQDRQARLIHDIASSLTNYVNDLLDIARTEAGRVTVQVSRFTADDALKAVRRILQPLATNPAVTLRFAASPGLQMTTDESKVAQVLRNLVANAIKFTPAGHVEVRALAAGPGRVAFEVEDTGIGIDAAFHELIFQEFAQVDGAVQARTRGSGLGLPLSRRLAELLGGTIVVHSSAQHGSRFRFELPAVYETATAGSSEPPPVTVAPVAPLPIESPPVPEGERLRVLVIDDDEASRYVLRRWLGDRYQVEEATGGIDGLAQASSCPAVIVLDVVMPDLTGFEVLDQLKANPLTAGIPVIVYSALSLGTNDVARLGAASALLRKSTSSRVADRTAIEDALARAGVVTNAKQSHHA